MGSIRATDHREIQAGAILFDTFLLTNKVYRI